MFPEIKDNMKEISQYVEKFKSILPNTSNEELTPTDDETVLPTDSLEIKWQKEAKYDERISDILFKKLNILKETDEIKMAIVMSNNLKKYKTHISDPNNLSCKFIKDYVGVDFMLFPFSNLNFKFIYLQEILQTNKINVKDSNSYNINNYILKILHLLYKVTEEIYKIITSPNIDAKKFGKILIDALAKIKTQIPRCNEAFKIIENSIGLFENNFDGYYKDFVMSKNPNIIIENFIADIADNNSNNSKVSGQFKEIIKFFRKVIMENNNNKDPMMEKIFEKLQSTFNIVSE
jgi:tetratricopeptide (TPR) repeat protein